MSTRAYAFWDFVKCSKTVRLKSSNRKSTEMYQITLVIHIDRTWEYRPIISWFTLISSSHLIIGVIIPSCTLSLTLNIYTFPSRIRGSRQYSCTSSLRFLGTSTMHFNPTRWQIGTFAEAEELAIRKLLHTARRHHEIDSVFRFSIDHDHLSCD